MSPTRTHAPAAGALLTLLAALATGCEGNRLVAKPLAPPIASDVRDAPAASDASPTLDPVERSRQLAERRYYQWVDEHDRLDGADIGEMLLLLGGGAREWREPRGPDGYVLRALLLDGEGKPTRRDGRFEVFAVHRPSGPEPLPLRAWTISAEQADKRYRKGITPGYLLELDWGYKPAPAGLVMIVVRWTSANGAVRITRNVVFEDRMSHGTRERYPRP
ncbi:MAG: hypothetical protein KGY99_06835 [Phycisphaerae bacterium]|nr:hypothetical protein [Phycisphaerae bacterium]